MGRKNFELHIILDLDGINCVQIVGSADKQEEGHCMYFTIRDLVQAFDAEVKKRLKDNESISNIN